LFDEAFLAVTCLSITPHPPQVTPFSWRSPLCEGHRQRHSCRPLLSLPDLNPYEPFSRRTLIGRESCPPPYGTGEFLPPFRQVFPQKVFSPKGVPGSSLFFGAVPISPGVTTEKNLFSFFLTVPNRRHQSRAPPFS